MASNKENPFKTLFVVTTLCLFCSIIVSVAADCIGDIISQVAIDTAFIVASLANVTAAVPVKSALSPLTGKLGLKLSATNAFAFVF